VPLERLLGGKCRVSVRLHTQPSENRGGPDVVAASCLEARNAGYDAINSQSREMNQLILNDLI
jgi:hypothetical protein